MESVKNMEIEILHRREGLGFQNRVGMETFVFVFSPNCFYFFPGNVTELSKLFFCQNLFMFFGRKYVHPISSVQALGLS